MKKITREYLKKSALFYLEKYETTTEKLRTILNKRLIKASREQQIPPEASEWIEDIVTQMCKLGYVNNSRYAENLVRRLTESGKSRSFIRTKLKLAGIDDEEITNALSETDELASARLMIQKKHLGSDYQKDLARLARAGFSYEIAREALEEVMHSQEF